MPSTYARIECHIIFSTKNRHPFLEPSAQQRLHDYLGGIVRKLGADPRAVGGIADHVHLLIGLKPTHSVAEIVRELKKASHRFLREEIGISNFSWQEGYAAFSVSASSSGAVIDYIQSQERHHRHKSFQEEIAEFLRKSGLGEFMDSVE